MARNDELHEQSELVQQLSAFIKKRTNELGYTTQDVADRIKHANSYAYLRLNGKAQFTLDDLVELSPFLGYKDIFAFWRAFDTDQRYQAAKQHDKIKASSARFSVTDFKEETLYDINDDTSTLNTSEIQLAAHHDKNKHNEQELDNFGA